MERSDEDVRAWLADVVVDDAFDRGRALRDVQQALFARRDPPLSVGRYRMLERLGGGGQGVVHAAYDPELDRRVAIKLLRAGDDEQARARLLREALALAKLSHPNVIAVLDVGECSAGIYVVTELVAGETLRSWLRAARPWREVLAVLLAAGRGLAAAHASGIVHRDFKPSNVLVAHTRDRSGAPDRVLLLDFGLARASGEGPSTPDAAASAGPISDGSLTGPGLAIGTPVYMAPEQHTGAPATAAADQYAFCVALHEALWGRRPFDGDDLGAIARAKIDGTLPPRPDGDPVPRAIHRVVARGLAPHPSARWPTMAALLAALQRGATLRRERIRRASLGVATVAVLAAAGMSTHQSERCVDAAPWSETWSEARSDRLRAAFVATGLGFAEDAATAVATRLDDYGVEWTSARAAACAAVESDRDADRRIGCLDRLRSDADTLVDVLERGTPGTVGRAAAAAAALVDPQHCAEPGPAAPEPAIAARVAELRRELGRARVLDQAGRYDDALAAIEPIDATAHTLAYPPLVAEASLEHGTILRALARTTDAAPVLEEAYVTATSIEYDEVAFEAALGLAHLHGNVRRNPDDAMPWLRRCEAVLARMGEDASPRLARRLATTQAGVLMSAGDYTLALARARAGVAGLGDETVAVDPVDTATAWSTLAQAFTRLGRLDEAEEAASHALALAERTSGASHPDAAWALQALASIARLRGDFTRALELQNRVLRIREDAFGPDDPTVAGTLMSIGVLQSELAQPFAAESSYRRALTIQRARLGDDHSDVSRTLHNLAITLHDLNRWEAAAEASREAIAIGERTLGPEHPDVAAYLVGLAMLLADSKQADEAIVALERAVRIRVGALGEQHPATADALRTLGHARRKAGDLDGAHADIARALAIFEATLGRDHVDTARARHELGNQLAAEGRWREALVAQRDALAVAEAGLGPDHGHVAQMLLDLSATHAKLGHAREATRAHARSDAIFAKHGKL